MEEILAVSDLFLLTSEYESFGLAALEAMAAGEVVISTNVGGLPEIVQHNITGFMANVGDVDTMSNYAIGILQDEQKLQAMKEAAFLHASNFDITNIIPLYEKLYSKFCRLTIA
jgi:glycosyltransferase involved in cell wall biosynthesis